MPSRHVGRVPMRVKEIHFNHDTTSESSDAINLRLDGTSVIAAPEWVLGERPKPAAYVRSAVSKQVTIKVKLVGGPSLETRSIRAVAPSNARAWALPDVPELRAVLGEVRKKNVKFDSNGESHLEEFAITGRLDLEVVGATTTPWIWQARIDGRWVDFDSTRHLTYVLPDEPKAPWCKAETALSSWQLPWAVALDWACVWAAGATTAEESTALIAKAINEHPGHIYDVDGTAYVVDDDPFSPPPPTFQLSQYLDDLNNAADILIDCKGTSSALVTFANLLGADLSPLMITNVNNRRFTTKPVKPFAAAFGEQSWGYHQVALAPGFLTDATGGVLPGVVVAGTPLTGGIDRELPIYDANLQLDQSAPFLPVKARLGTAGTGGSGYRFHLIAVGDAGTTTPKTPPPVV